MKRASLAALFVAIVLIAMAYAGALLTGGSAGWTPWVMLTGTALAMVATMLLGVARSGSGAGGIGKLLPALAVVFLLMIGAFAAALLLPGGGEPLLLGLPRRAALVLYGVGIVPVLILPIAYALTFDELTLTDEDIERVREAAARYAGMK